MAITYPRDIRTLVDAGIPFSRQQFSLVSRVASAQLPNRLQVMETSPKTWRCALSTSLLSLEKMRMVEAFLDSLGGAKSVLVSNLKFPSPASSGLPATTSISGLSGNSITLSLTTGLIVTQGDMIGLEQSGKFGLFRALETVTSASGSASVAVSPQPNLLFTTGATARLSRPVCEMILDPSSPVDSEYKQRPSLISFSLIQKAS
jgi:hypothetical protein